LVTVVTMGIASYLSAKPPCLNVCTTRISRLFNIGIAQDSTDMPTNLATSKNLSNSQIVSSKSCMHQTQQ